MRLLGSFSILILLSFPHFGQLSDDFSDGDFTNNPQWGGDTSEFIVNADFKLQLNAPSVTDTSYLSVETGTLDYNNSYPFVGLSIGTNFFMVKKVSNKRAATPNLIIEKKIRYEPKTGEEIQNQNSPKEVIYDPETGKIVND